MEEAVEAVFTDDVDDPVLLADFNCGLTE